MKIFYISTILALLALSIYLFLDRLKREKVNNPPLKELGATPKTIPTPMPTVKIWHEGLGAWIG